MDASRRVAVVEDPRYREHQGPPGHPERPDRLTAVAEAVEARAGEIVRRTPRAAEPEEILRVHAREHVTHVAAAAGRGPARLDPDTFVSSQSFEVARLAAGATIDLARSIARGELHAGLAAVRPPGHHAESDRAMGFCLFNNVALAARAVQAEEGVERVLIFDWDVHHGNGTQHFFEEDPNVLYASTHQYPYYPGTGAAREAGRGPGAGATVNIPLPAGCGDAEYIGAVQRLLAPVAHGFRPEIILVSCGFDPHRDDQLAGMRVSGEGFRAMAAILRALADDLCGGRLVCVLEGGYALSGLREGTAALLDVLLDPVPPPLPEPAKLRDAGPLGGIVDQVCAVHAANFSGLGAA